MSKNKSKEALGKGIRALLNNIDDEATKPKVKDTENDYEQTGTVVKIPLTQTEALIKSATSAKKAPIATAQKLPFAYQKIQDNIASVLSSKVNIKPKKDGSGEISIYFHDEDDFQRLVDLLES